MAVEMPMENYANQMQKKIDIEKLEKLGEKIQGMEDYGKPISMDVYLCKAIENDDVSYFISYLEQVEQVSASGNSVLHMAASFGSLNIARFIIDHFPSLLTRRNVLGDTALHVAIKARKLDVATKDMKLIYVMKVLIDANVNDCEQLFEMKNNIGNTALHEAVIAQCSLEVVEHLFSRHKEASYYLNDGGESPLCLAIETENRKILELLLDAPYENGRLMERPRKQSPVHAAIFMKRLDMLKKIFEKNKQLFNIRDEKRKKPLHYAASRGYIDGVRFLLINFQQAAFERSKNGDFPIHAACKRGHTKVVKEFLQQEWLYPTELLNNKSQNILHVAAENGKNDVVKAILSVSKLKKLINAVDENGNTALHLSSLNLHAKVICSLTWDKRVDLKRRNKEGLTAIDIASSIRNGPKATQLTTLWALSSAGTPFSEKGKKIISLRERESPKVEQIKGRIDLISVIAALVATVTFAAGLTVPGGFNSSDINGGLTMSGGFNSSNNEATSQGLATLGNKWAFQVFIVSNSVAMYCSITGALLLIWSLMDRDVAKSATYWALKIVVAAIFAMSVAFMSATYLVVSNISWVAYLILVMGTLYLSCLVAIFIALVIPLGIPHRITHCLCQVVIPSILFFINKLQDG